MASFLKRISVLTLFVLTLFFQSCSVEKWCNERYPPITSDSSWTIHDTITDTIYIPYEDVSFDTSGVVPEGINFERTEVSNGLTLKVSINKGRIKADCKSDSLMVVLKSEREQHFNEKQKVKYLPCEKEHRTKADVFCRWFTWITIIIGAIALIGYCYIRAVKG